MAQYEFERMFKVFVEEKGRNTRDNADFRNRLNERLDAIDTAGEVGSSRFPFKWTAVVMASAAALILCFMASIWVGDYYRYQAEIVPFIDAFTARAESHDSVDFGVDPFDYLEKISGIRLSETHFPAESISSVSLDTIRGVEFGRIEVIDPHDADNVISVFITSSADYDLPSGSSELINGIEMMVHRCEDCNLIGHVRNNLILIAVSNPCCRPDQLAQLTSAF